MNHRCQACTPRPTTRRTGPVHGPGYHLCRRPASWGGRWVLNSWGTVYVPRRPNGPLGDGLGNRRGTNDAE